MVYHRIERRPSILSCHSFDALFLTGHGIIMIISASSLGNLIHTWLTYDKTKKPVATPIYHIYLEFSMDAIGGWPRFTTFMLSLD